MNRQLGSQILVVSRNNALVKRVRKTFDAEGYRVSTVSRGQAAYFQLTREEVDLAIVDEELPDMSGFDLCRRFRQNTAVGTTPILMLISQGNTAGKIRVFEAGADNYLVKPFHDEELLHTAKSLLARGGPATSTLTSRQKRGRVIAFFGSKAGVGNTTLAVNHAVALQQRTNDRVVLVDADFFFGDIAIHLDLATSYDILGLVQNIEQFFHGPVRRDPRLIRAPNGSAFRTRWRIHIAF